MGTEKPKADLLPGTLDMLVLKILMRGHLPGYAVAQLIQQSSAEESPRYRQVTGAVARVMGFAQSNGEMRASGFTLEACSPPFTVLAGSQ